MNELLSHSIRCPYCGETIDVLIDASVPEQHYIEDCQVCCRPIQFDVLIPGEGEPLVKVSDENQ